MPLAPSPPLATTARCWACGCQNPTHIMPEVRLMKCQNPDCQAVNPSDTDYQAAIWREAFVASQTNVNHNWDIQPAPGEWAECLCGVRMYHQHNHIKVFTRPGSDLKVNQRPDCTRTP